MTESFERTGDEVRVPFVTILTPVKKAYPLLNVPSVRGYLISQPLAPPYFISADVVKALSKMEAQNDQQ